MIGDLAKIVCRISESDPRAFRELFDHYAPKVNGFAFRITRSESIAEEVVQDVFMKIWQHRDGLRTVEYFPAYLFAITRNISLNVLKRLANEERANKSYVENARTDHTEIEETNVYGEYRHILNQAIEGLPPQQKLVYSLCHGEGLKYEEVAQRLHISRLTVKTHMQHALRTIKSHVSMVTRILLPILTFIA